MFIQYNPNPCGRSVEDCTVRAISKVLNVSWDEAYDMLTKFGKNMCDLPNAGWVWGAVLRAHGFRRIVIPDTCPDCYTTKDFCEDNPEGTFVLGFGHHCSAIVDGNIYDSWDTSNEIPIFVWYKY